MSLRKMRDASLVSGGDRNAERGEGEAESDCLRALFRLEKCVCAADGVVSERVRVAVMDTHRVRERIRCVADVLLLANGDLAQVRIDIFCFFLFLFFSLLLLSSPLLLLLFSSPPSSLFSSLLLFSLSLFHGTCDAVDVRIADSKMDEIS